MLVTVLIALSLMILPLGFMYHRLEKKIDHQTKTIEALQGQIAKMTKVCAEIQDDDDQPDIISLTKLPAFGDHDLPIDLEFPKTVEDLQTLPLEKSVLLESINYKASKEGLLGLQLNFNDGWSTPMLQKHTVAKKEETGLYEIKTV